ncbi:DgyrCDS196 [Dimorphilus gyrociliatus]|uniref:guanylate cyclase n=1 Tax=Dimorphilus gyrociliatus TaxID=2664684 RepID=A0A7I8V443_9ANNE|nr:DgyrCDS196 [Dimorphilus gyrociliatus]
MHKITLFTILTCILLKKYKVDLLRIRVGVVGKFKRDLRNIAKEFNIDLYYGQCSNKCSFPQTITDIIDMYYDDDIKIFLGSLYLLDSSFATPFISAANLIQFGLKERICEGKEDLRNFVQLGPELISSIYSSKGFLLDYLNNQKWCSLAILYTAKIPAVKCIVKKLSLALKKDKSKDVRTRIIKEYFQIYDDLKYFKSEAATLFIITRINCSSFNEDKWIISQNELTSIPLEPNDFTSKYRLYKRGSSLRRKHSDISKASSALLSGGSYSKASAASLASSMSNENILFPVLLQLRTQATIYLYRDEEVVLRKTDKYTIVKTRHLIKDISINAGLRQQNLARFFGITETDAGVRIVMECCIKGDLSSVLLNTDIEYEPRFKYAFIYDIANGLKYIHKSSLKVHGNLSSSTCLVDHRMTVKISDYGFLNSLKDTNGNSPKMLLWSAPEVLAGQLPTAKSDIYSFGIIIQEIMTQELPYFNKHSSDIIITRVKSTETPPFRPAFSAEYCDDALFAYTIACWEQEPDLRPTAKEGKKIVKTGSNFVEELLESLQQYTSGLESGVEKSSNKLKEEQAKTQKLLDLLMPRKDVEKFKRGLFIEPEAYDCVTVSFIDINGFQEFCNESEPVKVIQLLNEYHSKIDNLVAQHNVFKAESIVDTYVIVAGLNEKNENHASEMATICTTILEISKYFNISKNNLNLKVKIGIHSGPMVSCVMGVLLPKYFLVGDTINTASRMVSNGEPLRIHITGETRALLKNDAAFIIEKRGEIPIKGKGEVTTYWLTRNPKTDSKSQH